MVGVMREPAIEGKAEMVSRAPHRRNLCQHCRTTSTSSHSQLPRMKGCCAAEVRAACGAVHHLPGSPPSLYATLA
jgi:hypothetical protein